MKKIILLSFLVASLVSCKKDDPASPSTATNTLTFGSVFNNVAMTGAANGSKWQLNAVIDLPAIGGFSQKLAFNVKFLQKPTSNANYAIVNTESEVLAGTAMLYINYVDYNPSPTANISSSYFLKSGTTGTIAVTVVSGKIVVKFDGLTLTGNRDGVDKANVSANLTEN